MVSPEFKISRKYKRISITVSELNQVVVKVPSNFYLPQAKRFFIENYEFVEKSISKNLNKQKSLVKYKFNFQDGDQVILFDEPSYLIVANISGKESYKVDEESDTLYLKVKSKQNFNGILEKFYRDLAYKYACERSDFYAKKLGVQFNNVRIKDTKTRWGSCSSNQNLNYNFRLILAPERVFDYLVIHEVCHLREMNHSKRFWNLVEGLMPDYKKQAKWLKENGFILKYFLR
jgi:predicted metal-dependent hydrolase